MNASTHDDAASALMALAANSKNGDDASMMEEAIDTKGEADNSSKAGSSTPSSNRFPEKLMAVLNSSDYTDIIAWSADGKSFIFLDSSSFERIVLPSIFKVAKFDSFLRKLYRWGFSKCQTHSRVGCPAYKHEKFNRDKPDLMSDMECRSKPKTQYGNAAPMTLTSFHQSAPQLRGNREDLLGNSAAAANAAWGQMQRLNSLRSQMMSPDVDTDMDMSDDVNDSSIASLLARHNAQPLLNGTSQTQQSMDQLIAQRLLNEQAASMGRSLMGQDNTAAAQALLAQQQIQASMADRPFSARSKTTPFNMKFAQQQQAQTQHQQNSPFANSSLGSAAQANALGMQQERRASQPNPFLQNMNIGSLVGQHQGQGQRNPLLEQLELNNLAQSDHHNQLLQSMNMGQHNLSQLGGGQDNLAAKLEELRQRERDNLLRNANVSSLQELEALRILSQNGSTGQMPNRMMIQNELERIEQLRLLQASQRLAQERHAAENEARMALIEKLRNGGSSQSFGP